MTQVVSSTFWQIKVFMKNNRYAIKKFFYVKYFFCNIKKKSYSFILAIMHIVKKNMIYLIRSLLNIRLIYHYPAEQQISATRVRAILLRIGNRGGGRPSISARRLLHEDACSGNEP